MMKIASLLAAVLFAASGAVLAAGAPAPRMEHFGADSRDLESLQRGARLFVNYCLNCHSAKYMRYNRLSDLGLDAEMIQDNLMFASAKIGEPMTVAMTPAEAKSWFGVVPPDLTVVSRVRGA